MIRNPYMVKQVYGATDLSLQAKSGESLLIKDVLIFNPVGNYATFKTEKSTVGYFRVGGTLGNHLPLPIGSVKHSHGLAVAAADGSLTEDHALTNAHGVSNAHAAIVSDRSAATTETDLVQFGSIPAVGYMSLLKFLEGNGIFKGYPVAEGETFLITGVNQATSLQVVIYEKYDATDILNTQANGSASSEYFFVNYGRVAANISTSISTLLGTVQSPAEFPDFPFGALCPAKTRITIHGLLASDVVDDRSGNDTMTTEYIKMIKGRETLFDDDKNGILMKGIVGTVDTIAEIARGLSLIGNLSDVDTKPPLMFPAPLDFLDGDEVNIYVTTAAGASQSASDILIADAEVGVICTVNRE